MWNKGILIILPHFTFRYILLYNAGLEKSASENSERFNVIFFF